MMKNFLCCLSLRLGTLFSAWFLMIFSIVLLVINFAYASQVQDYRSGHSIIAGILLFIRILFCAVPVIIYFPDPDEQCDKDSNVWENLKKLSVMFFLISIICIVVASLFIFLEYLEIADHQNIEWDIMLLENKILVIGVPACFTGLLLSLYFGFVVRSYYNSIVIRDNADDRRFILVN